MKDLRKLHRNSNIPKGMCIVISCLTVFVRLVGFYIAILQYSQRYVYRHFLSHSFCQTCWFLHCYFAIFPKVCVSSFLVTVFVRCVGFYFTILQP